MKKIYEKPSVEVSIFQLKDDIMDVEITSSIFQEGVGDDDGSGIE